jgi:hypothetical protein
MHVTQSSLDRYMPGSVSDIIGSMIRDKEGTLELEADGVMRSYAGNGTVLDYHQMDPDQVAGFAFAQVIKYQRYGGLKSVPDHIMALSTPPFADGRLVVDKEQLLSQKNMAAIGSSQLSCYEITCAGPGAHAFCLANLCGLCYYSSGPYGGQCT